MYALLRFFSDANTENFEVFILDQFFGPGCTYTFVSGGALFKFRNHAPKFNLNIRRDAAVGLSSNLCLCPDIASSRAPVFCGGLYNLCLREIKYYLSYRRIQC